MMQYYKSYNRVLPRLWIGNAAAAKDVDFIQKNGITMIVNATRDVPNVFSHVKYINLPVKDPGPGKSINNPHVYNMTKLLPYIVDNMQQEYAKGGSILVHCRAGIQRSAAIVVALWMKYWYIGGNKMTLQQAIDVVLRVRPVAFYGGQYVNFKEDLQYIR